MDIDVHAAVAQLYIQRAGGIAASEQRIFIRLLHGGLQKLRFYKSAVAEEELRAAVALAVGGRGDEARHADAVILARAAEHLRRHVAPHKGVDAGLLFPVAGGEEFFVSVLYKAYRHFRMPKRAAQRRKLAGGCLAAVALQEFQPRGGVIEQVAHGHRRPVRAACGEHLLNVPGLEHDAGAARVAATAGVEFYFRNRGYRRESFAAEAHRRYGLQPLLVVQLRCSVPQEGNARVLRRHAAAVVRDADIGRAPAADLDGYILRPSVERVLDQLLDDGSRTLDHLAGGDHISHMGLKYVYDRHMVSP